MESQSVVPLGHGTTSQGLVGILTAGRGFRSDAGVVGSHAMEQLGSTPYGVFDQDPQFDQELFWSCCGRLLGV